MEMNLMTDLPAHSPSPTYQPLQRNQCSSDAIYQELTQVGVGEAKYDLVPKTTVSTQPQPNEYHSLELNKGQTDEKSESVTKKSTGGDVKETAKKKVKMFLIVLTTVNIVILIGVLIVTIVAIVASTRRFEESISDQKLLTNQFIDLTAFTYGNISETLTQLNATNSDIANLAESTNINITSLHTQLINLQMQLQTRVSDLQVQITTEFNATNGNITFVHSQNVDLHSHVAHLQAQFTGLQLQIYCGPGEWRQVAYLNMSEPTQQCPSAWREYNTRGVRACGRPSTSGGSCPATTYSIDFQYRRVCGRVIGYQYRSPDGFHSGNINQRYVDGISITYGSPREHVWTFVAGVTENSPLTVNNCPCSSTPGRAAPSFVGNNYYCESGNPANLHPRQLYTSDKLWDGKQCEGSCCTGIDTPLWFKVELSNITTDNIEIRICGNETTSNEDTPVELVEIYASP